MISRHALLAAMLVLVPMVAGPAVGHAAEVAGRAEALRELHVGNRLFDLGDYNGALAAYARAYLHVPSPKLHFNLGQAYRYLGRLREACEAYQRFLSEAHDAAPALREEAARHVDELFRELGPEAGSVLAEPVPRQQLMPSSSLLPPSPSSPAVSPANEEPSPSPTSRSSSLAGKAPASDPTIIVGSSALPGRGHDTGSPVGVMVRADVDRKLAGAAGAAVITYALGPWVDAAVGTFWWPAGGRNLWGISVGAIAYLSTSRWRPLLATDAQLFFHDGARPAARAAAGLQWQPTRALGVFAAASLQLVGDPAFRERVSFVPTAGLQLRL